MLLFTVVSEEIHATHSSGADLQFRWIAGRTYEVTITFYRDCAGVAAPASITLNAKSASCGQDQNYVLNQVAGSGQEITFPCYSVQTLCTNSGSPYAGYQQYLYRNNITLPQSCTDWILSFYICCRNCAITTISNPCTENLYIEATMNNVAAPANSSPRFTNVPVALICINQSFTYNHGVIDADGDSLVYSFITPKTFNTSTSTVGNVTYNPGYSANDPLTSSPPVTINAVNGDIVMTPTVNGEIGATAILVEEYRNGIRIGSVIRDMQFLTRVCNPNFLPSATGINGSTVFDTVVCAGNSISFTVNSIDPNLGDTISMSWNDAISGASFSTTGAMTPQGTFSWTPTLLDKRSQPYSFTITVRDNACPLNGSQTYSYSILVPDIDIAATSPVFNGYNVACKGGSTATANIIPSGGDIPYTYSWNPGGQTTQTATSLTAGNYLATVTDANGCQDTMTIQITEPASRDTISVIDSADVSCNGGNDGFITISASGGVGPYSYSWNPSGQTTASATGLSATAYTVTITDQNGCTAQQGVTLSQPSALNASVASFSNVTCQGNANGWIKINVTGGTPPYTHSWSNGLSSDSVFGLAPATYRDTVRDSRGCTQIVTRIITEPGSAVSIPSSSLSTTNVSCYGLSDGVANVNPSGGTLPYSVSWSNGDIGNSADTLSAGSYTVVIVDGNGCTFDTTVTITQPLPLTSSFTNVSMSPSGTNLNCNGDTTGGAKAVPQGGTGPYTFSWSNSETLDSISNVGAGMYIVDIIDANSCAFTDTIILTEPASLKDSLLVKHVGCMGESSGGIRAVTYDGSPSYSYSWSHGAFNTDTVGNLSAGFYQVTITDTNGCQKIDTVTIQEPSILVPLIQPSTYIDSVNVTCHGDSTGMATLNVFGGTRPYTYLWSSNATDSFAVGLPAGVVTVLVVDSNGCSAIRSVNLSEPLPFLYSPVVSDPLCYGDASGKIVLNTSGSTAPYTYNWSSGSTADSTTNITSGSYNVIILDANSCRDSLAFTLNDPDSITVHATLSDYQGFNVRCDADSSGYITVNPTGGTGAFTYFWSNSATTDSIGGLSEGSYTVFISDGNGCLQDTVIVLTEPAALNNNINLSVFNGGSNVSCNGYIDGIAHAVTTGGVPPYGYLWSNGDVADSALGLGAGPHSVTVTDSNGCVLTTPFSLTEPSPVNINATLSTFNGFNVGCYGDSTACINITTSGGSGPYQYFWDTQDLIPDSSLCNLPADTFSVQIVDANGCQVDTFFILTTPQPLNVSDLISDYNGFGVQCNGAGNGFIDITMSGGVQPFSYNWSNSATTEDLVSLPSGNYQLIVTDANGCDDTVSYALQEPPVIVSTMAATTNITCNGFDDGTASVNAASGGIFPFAYSWSNGDNGLMSDSLSPGTVDVTITDFNGCSLVLSSTIAEPAAIVVTLDVTQIVCGGVEVGNAMAHASGGIPPYQFAWTSGSTDSSAMQLTEGSYQVTVTDLNGCMLTSLAVINPGDCEFELPTGFSPNGDGYNDYYVIHGLGLYPENTLKVFNRWGNEVFSAVNYRNDQWYGQNSDGERLPDGTYFVSFEVTGQEVRRNVYVDLRR